MLKNESGEKKLKKLTPKQQSFVNNIISGKNPSEAYIDSYKPQKATKETIKVEAQKMLNKPNIALTIKEHHDKMKQELKYTVKDSFLNLEMAQSQALEQGNINAYLKAEELKGKLVGLYTERKDIDVKGQNIQIVFSDKCKKL